MQVVVNELLTQYELQGRGRALLFLHGWGDKKESFSNLISNFNLENNQIVSLDLPGFGGTDTPKEPFGLQEYAEFVASFLQKLDFKPEVIIGHSNGGAIAIKLVSSGLYTPQKLILLSSSGIRSEYKGRMKALRVLAKIAKVPTLLLPPKVQLALKKKVYKSIGSDLFVAENMQETFKKVVGEDLQEQAANIAIPTLLVYGSSDTFTPLSQAEKLSESIATSKLEILDKADHFIHVKNSNEVYMKIANFIGEK